MKIVQLYIQNTKKTKQPLSIPKQTRILSVCVKHENLYVSVEQDVNSRLHTDNYQTVAFAIFQELSRFYVDEYQFLATVLLEFGNAFYHVFYRYV